VSPCRKEITIPRVPESQLSEPDFMTAMVALLVFLSGEVTSQARSPLTHPMACPVSRHVRALASLRLQRGIDMWEQTSSPREPAE